MTFITPKFLITEPCSFGQISFTILNPLHNNRRIIKNRPQSTAQFIIIKPLHKKIRKALKASIIWNDACFEGFLFLMRLP